MGNKWLYQSEKMFMGPIHDLMEEIHGYGSKFFLQIGAGFGRVLVMPKELKKVMNNKVLGKMIGTDKLLVAASDNMPNVWDPNVLQRAMTEEELQDIIQGFAKAAALCKRAGIDGIEIHAVHEGYLLDQFTIADDKVLLIEIFEKNGGRHQTLQIENSDLIKARLINDMHLKF